MTTTTAASRLIPSLSFSGAGFLGCYHLGVASCLLKHGLIESPARSGKQIICGSSAGSIVASALVVGVSMEDSMNVVLNTARTTRKNSGGLDCLKPGFSLIDQVEPLVHDAIATATDNNGETLSTCIKNKNLRIALTHPRTFLNPIRTQLEAYRYIDEFESVEDIVAASMLSSFVPGLTGPLNVNHDKNSTARTSSERIKSFGKVKHGINGAMIQISDELDDQKNDTMNTYWDGGLCNLWPVIDKSTLVITPINGAFSPNPFIAPLLNPDDDGTTTKEAENNYDANKKIGPLVLKVTEMASVGINMRNLETVRRISFSSEDDVLENIFQNGFDDARRFLKDKNMINQ